MTALPSGKVAFLLTDIEGSTRLWEKYPAQMPSVVALHEEVLTRCIEQNGGVIVNSRGEGDGCFAVFPCPRMAVKAACSIQQAMVGVAWSEDFALRVRAALHLGEAHLYEGNYYGANVNKCARLRDLGHGGQTLLSRGIVDAIRYTLPDGLDLRLLGSFSLRGIEAPEQVYQLLHDDLPDKFPPLRCPDARPNNLPVQLTRLIGRDSEIAALLSLLRDPHARLITMVGPAGTGKTRLAVEVASRLLGDFADGIFIASLAVSNDPHLVAAIIASTLGMREEPGRTSFECLKEFLRDKRLLLILDNFEQLLSAGSQIGVLLATCPWLRVLVTSRASLHLRGEHEFPVEPMAVPVLRPMPPAENVVEIVGQSPAVELFVERARAVRPGFQLTRENAAAVAEICIHLDGLPLAIELAAARIKLISPQMMRSQQETSSLRLSSQGPRDLPERHRTMRGAIDWSYDLLSYDEQLLLCRLAVFEGGFDLCAAESVGSGDLQIDVFEGVEMLLDKSLIRQESIEPPRFKMLEVIQEYALERLEQHGEMETMRSRHAEYFLDLAQTSAHRVVETLEPDWVRSLEIEQENLRGVLQWALRPEAEAAHRELGLWTAASLGPFWGMRGYFSEGRTWLDRLISLTPNASPPARAAALFQSGRLALDQNESLRAHLLLEECLTLYREMEDSRNEALTLITISSVMMNRNDVTAARSLAERGLQQFRQLNDRQGIAHALSVLANLSAQTDDNETAQQQYRESLAILREIRDRRSTGLVLNSLAMVMMCLNDLDEARRLLEESIAVMRRLNDQRGVALGLNNLGVMHMNRRDFTRAEALLQECLPIFRDLGIRGRGAQVLGELGEIARHQGDYARAVSYYHESLAIYRDLDLKGSIAWILHNLAWVAMHENDTPRASKLLRESLDLYQQVGSKLGIVHCIDGLAAVAELEERFDTAARLLGAAHQLRDSISLPVFAAERTEYDDTDNKAREALGDINYARHWFQGTTDNLEQTLHYALSASQ